jgi:hypothetical protein
MKTLDENFYIQIMDETPFIWVNLISSKIMNDNLPFRWKLNLKNNNN